MATHTPRSLLWLLANGSQRFGLIELLCSMPDGRGRPRSRVDPPRGGAHGLEHEAGSRSSCIDRATEAAQQGRRPADRPRHRRRSRVAVGPRTRSPAVEGPDRRLQLPRATGGDGWLDGFTRPRRARAHRAMRTVVDALHNLVMLRPLHPLAEARRSERRPGARKDPGVAREGRVDHVRGRGAGVHREGAGAHDQARDRHGRSARRTGTPAPAGRVSSECRSTRPTAARKPGCWQSSPARPAAARSSCTVSVSPR